MLSSAFLNLPPTKAISYYSVYGGVGEGLNSSEVAQDLLLLSRRIAKAGNVLFVK